MAITCEKHGDFQQNSSDHLQGRGCADCGKAKISAAMTARQSSIRLSVEEFKNRANTIHDGFYSYENVDFRRTSDKVSITCHTHGNFLQVATKHLLGGGCTKCANGRVKNGWGYSQWESQGNISKNFEAFTLYVITLENENEKFYKIGKTFRNMYKRFRNTPYNVSVLLTFKGSAKDVSIKERKLHSLNKLNKYTPLLSFDGKEECYSEIVDIVGTMNEN